MGNKKEDLNNFYANVDIVKVQLSGLATELTNMRNSVAMQKENLEDKRRKLQNAQDNWDTTQKKLNRDVNTTDRLESSSKVVQDYQNRIETS